MKPSPVEARALALVADLPRVKAIMEAQHAKGRESYGHCIDAWPAPQLEVWREAAAELADLITYLCRANATPRVTAPLVTVAASLEEHIKWLEDNR